MIERVARRSTCSRALVGCALAASVATSSAAARAQVTAEANLASSGQGSTARPSADDPTLVPVVHERRKGLVLGGSGGVAFGGSSGYPNNPRLLDDPDYYSSSPLLVGWGASAFLLGALTDWLSVGPTFTIATFDSARWKSTGWGAGLRVETYPLLKLVPALADTSVYAQLGVGAAELRAKGPYPTSDGTQSFFGFGLHHEWRLVRLLGGHAAAGPYVEYDAIRAPSIDRDWLSAGLRVVWYGGRVALDR